MSRMSSRQGQGKVILHRPGAEWLTRDICDYYKERAKDISTRSTADSNFNALCKELRERCDLTETQAINILNGYHINEYVAFHERLQKGGADQAEDNDTKEYLEWLARKEERKKGRPDDYGLLEED